MTNRFSVDIHLYGEDAEINSFIIGKIHTVTIAGVTFYDTKENLLAVLEEATKAVSNPQ